MTLTEIVNVVGVEEDPIGCGLAIASVLRGIRTGKPSTCEEDCSFLVALKYRFDHELYNADGLKKFMSDCPQIMALDIPEELLATIFAAEDCELPNQTQETQS